MEASPLWPIAGRIVSNLLQVRRELWRGKMEMRPLAEAVALARRLEPFVPAEYATTAEDFVPDSWFPGERVDVSRGYAIWSQTYDQEANPLIAMEEPTTLALVGDVAGRDVLDVACGTGRYALRFAQAGARVSGVDGTSEMLAQARRKRDELGLEMDLREADFVALPFPEASFDLVVCALALCHATDLAGAVREQARVLRPGGKLVISDFHPFCHLLGWRTIVRQEGKRYLINGERHLISDYVAHLLASGLTLTALREETVDDRLVPLLGEAEVERYRGTPLALVLSACRAGSPNPAQAGIGMPALQDDRKEKQHE